MEIQMYKKSQYNIEVETLDNGSTLLYNTNTSSFGIMDRETRLVYDNIENIMESQIESHEQSVGIKTLISNGYVVPKQLDEYGVLKLQERINKFNVQGLGLTIAPTMDCNMACPYCFEAECENRNYMSIETQEKLCEFVFSYLEQNNCKYLQICWYGGEPLLAVDVIQNLSSRFIEYCNGNNVEYSASMITNGYLLDKSLANLIVHECKINLAQITIDGIAPQHNIRRILKSGEASYDTIVANVDHYKDLMQISIRINVDADNVESVRKFWKYSFEEKGWKSNPSVYLAPVTSFSSDEEINGCVCLTNDEFAKFNTEHLNYVYDTEKAINPQKLIPQRLAGFCGAVKMGVYTIDPDGDMYTCWNLIGNKDKKVASVSAGTNLNYEYFKWMLHEASSSSDNCESCSLLPVCSGGCPYYVLEQNKNVCHNVKYTFKENLKLMYRAYVEKKNALA